ncbi:MAG TPA: hypothetical protein VGO47_14195, partial [Chlamydiales bacterium]|nr:hypothetical protein [Chlamydiales bacterium]
MPRKRQGVSLIQGLPVELLSSIFYWASYIESSGTIQRTPSRGIVNNHAPLTLFKVCKRWRSIALNTPILFTQLYILEKFPVDIGTIVPLWLECSKSLPLKIWLNLQDVKHNYKPRGFDSIILQIRKHLDRIIFFSSSFSYHLSLLFPANETICLPALQHLEIASIGKRHEHIYIGFVSAPCLTTVVLGSQSIGLTQLHLGGHLTRFMCHREATLTCMQFYALLAYNPKLVECSVITVERRSLAADSAKITETYPTLELPNLTNLSISWITSVDYLS